MHLLEVKASRRLISSLIRSGLKFNAAKSQKDAIPSIASLLGFSVLPNGLRHVKPRSILDIGGVLFSFKQRIAYALDHIIFINVAHYEQSIAST